MLCTAYLKTPGQQQKVIHTGVGYPPHSVRLNTIMCYVRRTEKHPSNNEGHPHRGWVTPALGQTQHYNALHSTYLKTSEQQQKVIHTGVGYPTLSQTQHYNALRSTYLKTSEQQQKVIHTGVGYPTLGQTQHYNVLHADYLKTSEQQQKVIHTGVGYPPHSVKLNTVMCYARITSKHLSNNRRSSTPGLGTPHTRSNSTPSLDSSGGHRIYRHISVVGCDRMDYGVHFVVNPAAHVSQCVG